MAVVKVTANIQNLNYNVCAAEPFVTKPGVEIHHHKLECPAEKERLLF